MSFGGYRGLEHLQSSKVRFFENFEKMVNFKIEYFTKIKSSSRFSPDSERTILGLHFRVGLMPFRVLLRVGAKN
jgi:hypothetical protein